MISDAPSLPPHQEIFFCQEHQAGETLSESLTIAARYDDSPTPFATSQGTTELHYQRRFWGLPVTISVDQGEMTGATGVSLSVRQGRDEYGMARTAYDTVAFETRRLLGEPLACDGGFGRPTCWWRSPRHVLTLRLVSDQQVPDWLPDSHPPQGMLPAHRPMAWRVELACAWTPDLKKAEIPAQEQ